MLGYPVRISGEKYPRNFLIFNLCFVCDSDARTVQYELVVRKLAEHLVTLEVEQNFLSSQHNRAGALPKLLSQILNDINDSGLCNVTGCKKLNALICLDCTTLHLFFLFYKLSGVIHSTLESCPSCCRASTCV